MFGLRISDFFRPSAFGFRVYLGDGQVEQHVTIQSGIKHEYPEIAIEIGSRILETRRALAAKFQAEVFAAFELQGYLMAILSEPMAGALGCTAACPRQGFEPAKPTDGLVHRKGLDAPLRARRQRPLVVSFVDKLTHLTTLANRYTGHLLLSHIPN